MLAAGVRVDNWSLVCFVFGRFMLGYWAGRRGLLQRPEQHLSMIRRIFVSSLVLGIALTLTYRNDALRDGQAAIDDAIAGDVLRIVIGSINLALGIAFATGFVLLYRNGFLLRGLQVLAPAGRMALTHYLAQSVISTVLFYGIGAGMGPYSGVAPWLIVWAAVFTFQVLVSHLWLARFRYGQWSGCGAGRPTGCARFCEKPLSPRLNSADW